MSTTVKNWTEWLEKSRFSYMSKEQKEQTLRWLFNVRDKVLDRASLKPGDTVIDIGTGTGLLAFGAYERLNGTGHVIASDKFQDCVDECAAVARECGINSGFETLVSDAAQINMPDNSVDVVVLRSVLVHIHDKSSAINEFYRILRSGGRLSLFEPIICSNTRYYELINPANIPDYEKFKQAEQEFMSSACDPLTNFDENTLMNDFRHAGFSDINLELAAEQSTYTVLESMIDPWFNTPPSPGTTTMKEKFMKYFDESNVNNYIQNIKADLSGKTITIKSHSAYITAHKS